MVDPRAKGAEGERQVRDLLRKHTELEFQRVPMSGALDFMKGDIFLPNMHNNYCCLLYTSPSPRDRTRSRMPSSA